MHGTAWTEKSKRRGASPAVWKRALLDKEQDVLWAFAVGNLTEKRYGCAETKLARYAAGQNRPAAGVAHTANMKIDRQTLRKRMTEQG